MSSEQRVYIEFCVDEELGYSDELFHVTGFEGVEEISQPFRFEINLVSDDPNIDMEALVGQKANLNIRRDDHERAIYGVISELSQAEETQFDYYSYKAVLVPRMWLNHLSRQNQIYQEQNVPDIVKQELLDGDGLDALLEDDLEFRLSETYEPKEYVVQYKETDLNFVSRLLEHEGIYFYFEHQSGRDCLVFCDDKSKLDPVDDACRLPYVTASGLASFEDEAIHSFRMKQAQISKQLILKDFNYRKPHLPLQGEAETTDTAVGRLCEFGDHAKHPKEADDLAKIRAQMHLCRQKVAVGQSDALMLEAGKLFEQIDHFREDYNGEYLVTRIVHRAGQSLPGIAATSDDGEAVAYMNEFEALSSDIEFRPALNAVKPKLFGTLNAIVDGPVDNSRAQIDDQGRYKLIMPFDMSGAGEGKATRWVRKAETYGGQGTGMHFPLLKGTEVIWSCIDGDVDRPIITGVVSNPQNKSVVDSTNYTRNVIKTASGITMIMDDGFTSGGDSGSSGSEQQQTRFAENTVYQQAGQPLMQQQQHTPPTPTPSPTPATPPPATGQAPSATPSTTPATAQSPATTPAAPSANATATPAATPATAGPAAASTTATSTAATSGGKSTSSKKGKSKTKPESSVTGVGTGKTLYSVLVEDYNKEAEDSYFRMGYPDNSKWEEQAGTAGKDKGAGILLATHGSIKQKSYKNFFSQTSGISFTQALNSSGTYARGYTAGVKLAGATNIEATYGLTMGLGLNAKLTVGTDVAINYGIKFASGATKEYKNVTGNTTMQSGNILIRASDYDGKTKAVDKVIGGGTVLAGLASAGTTIAAVPIETGTWSNSSINEGLLTTSGITSAATVAGSIAYALRKISHEKAELKKSAGTESFIAMDNDSIILSCDGSSIVINGEGVFINGKTLAAGQLPKGKDTFVSKEKDLEDAKVGRIYPEFINLNATKRVDIRSQEAVYLSVDEKLKMDDKLVPNLDGSKMSTKTFPPPVPPKPGKDTGVIRILKSGEVSSIGGKLNMLKGNKTSVEMSDDALDVKTKEAKYSGKITAKGQIKGNNADSGQ